MKVPAATTPPAGRIPLAKVVASFFGWEFLDTQDLITIDIDGTVASSSYEKIARVIDPKKRYVIPGFYGSDNEGIIRTFSRGGAISPQASLLGRLVPMSMRTGRMFPESMR